MPLIAREDSLLGVVDLQPRFWVNAAVGPGEAGYRVVIVEDAVYSPFGAHGPGIVRLRDLGFELVRCKSVHYDWIRTLPAARIPGTPPGAR
jgi:hypothetical protein